MPNPLQDLAAAGQSIWIDFLARDFVRGGGLEKLVEEAITGVTSNPTIFQGAISKGDAYDDQLREVLEHEDDLKEVFLALAIDDIRDACDILRPVFERGDSTRDGWVSLEVDPNLAYDATATLEEARRLKRTVERENLFVKIPGTEPDSRRSRTRSPTGFRST